jgi:hypothetical protein
MKNFIRCLMTMISILLVSSVMQAQLQVSSTGGKIPVLPGSRSILYEQTNSSGSGQASQDFEPEFDLYDCQGADDFYVPASTTWDIQTVTAWGTGSLTADVVNVLFYADVAGIPASTATNAFMGLSCIISGNIRTISIPGGLSLGTGHYWLSVQDASPFGTDGQWYWARTASIYNSGSCWRNPGDGFGTGAVNWTTLTALGIPNSDFMFRLEGALPPPVFGCIYKITLYDAYGDGWNGCSLDVKVNGNPTNPPLDGITFSSGSGPAIFYFNVSNGDQITTVFHAGSYPSEPYYYIYNSLDAQVWYSPNGNSTGPPDIAPGQLYGSCPEYGNVEGYVYFNGLALPDAEIMAENGPSTFSGTDGHYFLEDVFAGYADITCTKTGYNPVTDVVAVVVNNTVTHNFTLTQPAMEISPHEIFEVLLPTASSTVPLTIKNKGNGMLGWQATTYYANYLIPCDYYIVLYDLYGDGWNGNTITLLINGVPVPSITNVTLVNGYGPVYFSFTAVYGDQITTYFTAGPPPSWPNEPYYYIYDSENHQIWYSHPGNSSGPVNIQPGDLTILKSCDNWLSINNYSGSVAPAGTDNRSVLIDASLIGPGGGVMNQIYNAEIVFNSDPDVGTITVPVVLYIADPDVVGPIDLSIYIVDIDEGKVMLKWNYTPNRSITHFIILRNGQLIGTTSNNSYIDQLEFPGHYCYKVCTVFSDGSISAPSDPICFDYPMPPSVPLSNWALVIAGLLIGSYSILMIRRRF